MAPSLLIRNASEVLTCADAAPDGLGRIRQSQVLIRGGLVEAVGHLDGAHADVSIDAAGGVVMPGFVDCHTHVVWGGTRVAEYAAGVAGEPTPAGAPVGILGTVRETREASLAELVDQALPRLREMLAHGTTTVESKTGYGLRRDVELRMLEANRQLDSATPVDVVSTFLGAHALPPDRDRSLYVQDIIDAIPQAAALDAAFCDAYCDEGYFTTEETRRILTAGREHGLAAKLHLDAYSHTGAADIAAELQAVSVDHLNHTPAKEVERLAAAGVVGVVMPCLDFAVAHDRPARPRELLARGLQIALATDCCPGAHVTSMQLAVQLGCRLGGLSVAQAIRAATLEAARAAGRVEEVGSLEPGKRADVLVLDVPTAEDLAYRLGHNAVRQVLKDGELVVGPEP